MLSRRRFLGGATGAWLVLGPAGLAAQEGVFLTADEASRQLFPDAGAIAPRTLVATPALQQRIRDLLGGPPSLWEESYRIATITRADAVSGFVVVVEEIGKHRPITFAVGVRPDGKVKDMAVLAYREAYGGEIKDKRFLVQYRDKGLGDILLPYRDIRNISGATLSVQATGRAARKAIAVLRATGDLP
jgi:FMN-binding protein